MTPAQALERLKAGNARFLGSAMQPRSWSSEVSATAGGQYPFAAVLSCMDSRVPAEVVFDQGIGDMFSVRVAGNVVDEDDLGSLEYAVHAGVKLLVVMGHTRCGAVRGALDRIELGSLTGLVAKIHPAVDAARCDDPQSDACARAVVELNVRESMRQIRARSPLIAEDLAEKKVQLVGAIYDVDTGKVAFLSE
jgi:carbonic anhydrase